MPDDLQTRIRALMRSPDYRPMNKSELARHLGLQPKKRAALREAIRSLESAGEIAAGKKARYSAPQPRDDVLVGTFRTRADGGGFFFPERDHPQNARARRWLGGADRLLIPARAAMNALDGDTVVAKLRLPAGTRRGQGGGKGKGKGKDNDRRKGKGRGRGRGPEPDAALQPDRPPPARIVSILERGERRFTGVLEKSKRGFTIRPDSAGLPDPLRVHPDASGGAAPGDKVVAVVERWDSSDGPAIARVVEALGDPSAPGVDVLAILHKFNLPLEFPNEVLAETGAVPDHVRAADRDGRDGPDDWRDRFVMTIDPFDARDFDDAIHVAELPDDGGWELTVHIADVAHYVRPGSATDREALHRGNSTYLVDRVIPMLPEPLSNGICSLVPGEDRLTRAVQIRFKPDGTPKKSRFFKSVINSKKRLSYEQAYALLKSPKPGDPVSDHLATAWALAAKLRARRFASGSLDLDFAEVKVHIDPETGKPTKLERVEYDESHQLIEEFMLAANEAVARKIREAAVPAVYRIHEDPDPAKLDEFAELARAHGVSAGDLSLRGEIQKTLEATRGLPEEHALKLALLKSLKRARYDPLPLGHFGLAKRDYTHFTSPIRRYADLVVHRVLDALAARSGKGGGQKKGTKNQPKTKTKTPGHGKMGEIADHISDTERNSAEAESESRRLKELEFLDDLSRSPDAPPLRAAVTEVRAMGLFVELTEFLIRGAVLREDLAGADSLRFDPAGPAFVTARGKKAYKNGDTIDVRVARVDFERLRVDFAAL